MFADQLRTLFGIEKPQSSLNWKEWENKTKQDFPVGFWLTETVPEFFDDYFGWIVRLPREIRGYVRNRWVNKLHYLPTGLKPGRYYDYDERLLHGMMQSMVDFVETEKPWGDEQWNGGRDPEAALRVLDWEIGLGEESPHQAATAKELKAIYLWWKNVRMHRIDPMDASGWSAFCDEHGWGVLRDDVDEEQKNKARFFMNYTNEIENSYNKEDEEYLIRLVKIRLGLWT